MLSSPPHHAFLCSVPSPAATHRRRAAVDRLGLAGRNRGGGGNVEFDADEEQLSPPRVAGAGSTAGVISSPSNPFVKHCVKLRQSSSYRRSCGMAVVVGLTPIRETDRRGGSEEGPLINSLLLLDVPEASSSASPVLLGELGINGGSGDSSSAGARVVRVSSMVMKKLTGLQSTDSTEAVAVMKIPSSFHDVGGRPREAAGCSSWFSSPPRRLLVLDGIQDPGNIGTLLRSAMAFRWDGVFLLPGCCDPFNEKALRAARGASFQLPIISGDWVHLEVLKTEFRMKMLAAHPEDINANYRGKVSHTLSQELADSLAEDPLCLVLGSEGQGLSQEAMHGSDLVNIPMAGNFESLNVSVAGGIFMFTLQTQYWGNL
ncbi:unnamed protein product [Spirodela intermedia]|uniref:tRNA/rRNA methyltransferase SpoU type domain-containing protein n=1 Tax=Spirodela intermedia TaxID=51605 RepID=A0A7I8KFC5_SPIIN|nr:unnamed protein product [Spirodela intermedia]